MKVLMVSNHDWSLYNYRLPVAKALQEQGCNLVLVCPSGDYVPKLREAGFRVLDWHVGRWSLNPVSELLAVVKLAGLYRKEAPDVVHHFTMKPNLYGTIAARFAGIRFVINTWTGLGFFFSQARLARGMRQVLSPLIRVAFRTPRLWTIFQNQHDSEVFIRMNLIDAKRSTVIPGSGVDTDRFAPRKKIGSETAVVLMASRLLWDKGIGEFVRAAHLLRERGVSTSFWVAGSPDKGNPRCVSEKNLERWRKEGIVEFLGYREDMTDLLPQADVATLPSYYNEGVPKFLLEAAAVGLPIVTTDIESCRMVVNEGVNGLLVPPKDPHALADSVERLIKDPCLRARMGRASREIAIHEFDQRRIVQLYLEVYQRIGAL